jgi:hypothetical protein
MAYRIHFTDDYGQSSFDVDTWKEATEAKDRLNKGVDCFGNPSTCAWDIWVEDLNPEY